MSVFFPPSLINAAIRSFERHHLAPEDAHLVFRQHRPVTGNRGIEVELVDTSAGLLGVVNRWDNQAEHHGVDDPSLAAWSPPSTQTMLDSGGADRL